MKNKNKKLYVVRLKDNKFTNSRPCSQCVQWLYHFKIKVVVYSNDLGDSTEKKIKDIVLEEQHISGGYRNLLKYKTRYSRENSYQQVVTRHY